MKISKDKHYTELLTQLKEKVRTAQIKAAITVNESLLSLYWEIGEMITGKQATSSWGNSIVETIAEDLSKEFPEMKGFSRANLFSIRKWYLFYSGKDEKVQQAVGQLPEDLESQKVQQLVRQIPWGHNVLIISKISDRKEAEFYVKSTIENNWSRNVLGLQIESNLYGRQGKLTNNFTATLPKPQSDLARQTLKDPYIFDFLSVGDKAHEREVEDGLIQHITKFLLELGAGFAYMGRQYHLEVGGQDYYLDLLFYHVKLRCYVVIELKVGDFKPEYAGKVNFYLAALDDLIKGKEDNPSIGIILCKSKNKVIAEYSLKDSSKPIGVAEYKLTETIPKNLRDVLPSVEDLEKELGGEE